MADTPLTYKGRPLLRCNNEIYYGSPSDDYVVFMQILSFVEQNGEQVADKVNVKLLSNDPALTPRARIIKESEKTGLYGALDIGSIWLERALAEK